MNFIVLNSGLEYLGQVAREKYCDLNLEGCSCYFSVSDTYLTNIQVKYWTCWQIPKVKRLE